jgi:hypothetical protein
MRFETKKEPRVASNDGWMGLDFKSNDSHKKRSPDLMTEELNWILETGFLSIENE